MLMYGSSVVCAYVSVQVLRSSALVTIASQQHMFIQATYVCTYASFTVLHLPRTQLDGGQAFNAIHVMS